MVSGSSPPIGMEGPGATEQIAALSIVLGVGQSLDLFGLFVGSVEFRAVARLHAELQVLHLLGGGGVAVENPHPSHHIAAFYPYSLYSPRRISCSRSGPTPMSTTGMPVTSSM